MKKREVTVAALLTVLIAFMDISGLPSALVVNIQLGDINPIYFILMVNFILIGILAWGILKKFCPNWHLGFTTEGLKEGIKQYGLPGFAVGIICFIAFYIGLRPFDVQPSMEKVLVEGIIYYIGLAIIEELYVRGLLLNVIEKWFANSKNSKVIAIVLSSVIFGLGHIFGVLNQSPLVIISKVVWTIGMGMYFGAIYKKTNNLWLPIILHFFTNICAIPYCFSSMGEYGGYADVSLYMIVPAYLLLGGYSMWIMKEKNK